MFYNMRNTYVLTQEMGKLFNMRQVEVITLRLKVVDFGWNV